MPRVNDPGSFFGCSACAETLALQDLPGPGADHRLGRSPILRKIAAPRGCRRNGSNSGWLAKP